MKEKDERFTVRVSAEKAEAMDEVMTRNGIRTRSDLIRRAIDDYIRANTEMWNAVKLNIQVPRGLIRRLDALVDGGDVLSREYAIHEALIRHIEHYEDFYLHRRKGIIESRKEAEAIEKAVDEARDEMGP